MSAVETIVIEVITAIISTFIIEWIRESRKSGKQFLEKAVDATITILKAIVNVFRFILNLFGSVTS